MQTTAIFSAIYKSRNTGYTLTEIKTVQKMINQSL